MSPTSKQTEEPKATLPVGHPQAGYVTADLSLQDGVGTLPDIEQAWNDERDEAREADVEAVADHEDKVAKEERDAAAKETKDKDVVAPKASSKASD
jgi:hypothetical protein